MTARQIAYPGNVVTGTLNSSIAASGTVTFQVTGWPSSIPTGGLPFVCEVGPGLGDDEKILLDSFSSGTATIDTSGRGWDSTTPQAHQPGEKVTLRFDATSAVNFSNHVFNPAQDDHSQYLNVARHDTTARHGTASVSHSLIAGLANDDHAQYYNQARHDAHPHPAGAFATGPGVITRAMLAGAAQGLLIGQLVARPGGISVAEQSFLLPADGSAVSRTTWSLLFAQIGVIYGVGDGSTTFNVPDARDMVVLGACTSNPSQQSGSNGFSGTRSARPEASTVGEETHLLTAAEMPVHNHASTDTGHVHGISDPHHAHSPVGSGGSGLNPGLVVITDNNQTIGLVGSPASKAGGQPASALQTAAAATGVTVATGHAAMSNPNTGGGGGHNTFQPSLAVPIFIVAA